MSEIAIVDMRQMAAPPALTTTESALTADYSSALIRLAAKTGVAGRVVLSETDDAEAVESAIKWAAISNRDDVKIYRVGNVIFFYVAGPEPKEFLRQYALRDPAAGT